jgi:Peptidase family M28
VGAEELGLVGSTAHVEGLSEAERDRIALYLNYDMVGSPNYIFMVYDADQSTFPAPAGVPIPPGSTAIEDPYESYYTLVGEPYDDTQFSGRSDYQAFIEAGIPAGGLFTGAEVVKTPQQAAIWGGDGWRAVRSLLPRGVRHLGERGPARPGGQQRPDRLRPADLAYSTESVNGVPGERVPGPPLNLPAPAGPEGTFATTDGGGGPGPIES